jgi:hypothetical protein
MTIGALIAFQLVFDLLLVLLLITVARQRRAPVAPPAWHDEFLQLARDVMAVADSLLEAPERRAAMPELRAAMPERREAAAPQRRPVNARDEAFTLLRGGMEPDAVARRTGLLPGELRLITSLVAAQQRGDAPERRGDAPERRGDAPERRGDAPAQALRTRQALPTVEARRRGGAVEHVDFPELNSSAAPGTALA